MASCNALLTRDNVRVMMTHLDPRVPQLATHHRRAPQAPVVITHGAAVNKNIALVMKFSSLTIEWALIFWLFEAHTWRHRPEEQAVLASSLAGRRGQYFGPETYPGMGTALSPWRR